MCLGCSFIGSVIWAAITVLLILHRRSIKRKTKKDIAESLEDARIWASDMSPANHYEKISMKNINQQYESIKNMNQQVNIKLALGSLTVLQPLLVDVDRYVVNKSIPLKT